MEVVLAAIFALCRDSKEFFFKKLFVEKETIMDETQHTSHDGRYPSARRRRPNRHDDPYRRRAQGVAAYDRPSNRALSYRKERRRLHWEQRKARMRRG